jgi:hypothetical protein
MRSRGMLAAGDGGSSGDGPRPLQVESQQLLQDLVVAAPSGPAASAAVGGLLARA